MKLKLPFLVLFVILVQIGFGQNRNAALQIEFSHARTSYAFKLGNDTFTVNQNILLIDRLRSGFHPVQIYEFRGNRKALVYTGGVNLAANATTLSFFRNGNFEVFFIEPYEIENPVVIEVPVVSNTTFQQLKRAVQGESFDSGRLELLESTLVGYNYFKSFQIKELMELLSFESGRLQFAKSAYTRVVDPENYFLVREALSHSSSKSELTQYINTIPVH